MRNLFGSRTVAIVVALSVTIILATPLLAADMPPRVSLLRVPDGGIQPQVATDRAGGAHLVYFKGTARGGDLFYVQAAAGSDKFSKPLAVNSQSGSAIAVGNIRGAQLAVGRSERVHVAWMGSSGAEPKALGKFAPMLYARLTDDGRSFEPQRNVITAHAGLDGGGSVAADERGRVYVAWHGHGESDGEANRRVWVAASDDDGATFQPETAADPAPVGACACCGMRAMATDDGTLLLVYRTAREDVHRDMLLLRSTDRAASFQATKLQDWNVDHCVMSSASLSPLAHGALAAWETEEQVYFAQVGGDGKLSQPVAAPGEANRRKHPVVAANARGEIILVWTEGLGWEKGGALAWQVYDSQRREIANARGRADGVPTWSLVGVFARGEREFTIVY